jgi:hypothetical protein
MQIRGAIRKPVRKPAAPEAEKWKRFESLVAQIQKELAPECTVAQNQMLPGRLSGIDRQVDILLRGQAGQFDLMIVIDCKDYKRPVNVKCVEEFIGMVEDIGAHRGAMVSSNGFSASAKARGARAGVDLYTLVDSASHNWQTYMSIPVVCDFRRIKKYAFKLSIIHPPTMDLSTGLPTNLERIIVRRSDGSVIDLAANLLCKKWLDGQVPIDPGVYNDFPITDDQSFVSVGGRLLKLSIKAEIHVSKRLFFGYVPLSQARGFWDEARGRVITRQIETEYIDMVEVENSWARVENIGDLAVKPVLTFVAADCCTIVPLPEANR